METYTTLAGGENPAAGHHRLLLFVPLEENLHQQAIGHSTPHPWRRHRIRTESTDNIYTRMQRPSNEKRGKAGSIPRGAKPPGSVETCDDDELERWSGGGGGQQGRPPALGWYRRRTKKKQGGAAVAVSAGTDGVSPTKDGPGGEAGRVESERLNK